jgi:type II secretory pathway predicted ATPase ExeA
MTYHFQQFWDIATRVAQFEASIITHNMHENALSALEADLLRKSAGQSAKGRMICGNSGAGKTTLLNVLLSRYPDVDTPDGIRRKIVLVELPEATTKKALVKAICEAMGYPARPRMTTNELIDAIADLVERLGVAMIILDEAHHMLVRRELEPTTEFLKSLLNRVKCQIVLVGLPRITGLKDFEQLDRRLHPDILLKPYAWDNAAGRIEFLQLMYRFEENLGLPEPSNLADPMIAARLYVACRGHVGIVSKYLAEALKRALERGMSSISLQLLAEIHASWHPPIKPPSHIDFFADVDVEDISTIDDLEAFGRRPVIDVNSNPFACGSNELSGIWRAHIGGDQEYRSTSNSSRRTTGTGPGRPKAL